MMAVHGCVLRRSHFLLDPTTHGAWEAEDRQRGAAKEGGSWARQKQNPADRPVPQKFSATAA
jgi:hypothetical protein